MIVMYNNPIGKDLFNINNSPITIEKKNQNQTKNTMKFIIHFKSSFLAVSPVLTTP